MSKYIALNSDEKEKKTTLILGIWEKFLESTKSGYIKEFGNDDTINRLSLSELYDVNMFALREVFERTHQREDYFDRYHDKLIMSNFKEIGLIAFWIVKFKPFQLNTQYFNEAYALRINEEFALYYIFTTLSQYAKNKGKKFSLKRIHKDLYNELLYSMQYRDLSKEAYGCIVELISVAAEID